MFRRFAALLAALGLVLAFAAPALATDLSQDPPISWDDEGSQGSEEECDATDLDPGEVLWHFILTDAEAEGAKLTAVFETAGEITVEASAVTGNATHFEIITGEDTLLSASTDIDGSLLNLSHICSGGPPPEIPEAPFAAMLGIVALLAFGGYLLVNRRRADSVA